MIENLDDHYPTIDKGAMHELILKGHKLQGTINIGETTVYVSKGSRPIPKRSFLLRETDGQVGFMHSTALAANFGCMNGLLKWFEKHRNWRDGGYFVNKAI